MGPEPLTKHRVPAALETREVSVAPASDGVAPAPFEIRSRRDPMRERRTGCARGLRSRYSSSLHRSFCWVAAAWWVAFTARTCSVPPVERQTTHINEPIQVGTRSRTARVCWPTRTEIRDRAATRIPLAALAAAPAMCACRRCSSESR